uniref:ADAM metallopeptidase domain 11 n=1 Tax=Ursus maritimus TaxID=29073 RepID=A0A452UF77_URSMA
MKSASRVGPGSSSAGVPRDPHPSSCLHAGGGGMSVHVLLLLQGAGDHCYYQGKLRGNPHSFAALSTCQGLHGVFSDGNFTYIVEPREMARPQDPPQVSPSWSPLTACYARSPCGLSQWQVRGPHRPRAVRRGHPTVHSETKYVELIVVNDHQLMRQSVVLTSNFAKSVVNLADVMYKEQLNTRIVLVAMETWADGDKIQVQDDLLETLARLMVYRREGLPEPSDATHLFSGRTFQSTSSGAAYVGGICSLSRGGGVNEVRHGHYDNMGAMAVTLAQTLGQNLGMMWNKHRSSAGDCKCPDNWLGCIMEDTGFYLPRKFSRCSIDEYNQFLQEGGGSCLFNKPLKLLDPPECGNGFVEAGEECDCGSVQECSRAGGNCCKKCTLTHDAMCSDGLCCRRCKYEPRGVSCREAVNECDIAETCTGDSSQCPPNLHKLDGYYCDQEQGRCYGGRCKTRDRQCQALWGHAAADRFCYEKLNVEGTERGNCGRKGSGWVQCNKQDVLCGFLLCVNISGAPRLGDLGGDINSVTFYHQGKELDCRGGHVQLADGSDLSYVEDGTACGPNMLCLDHRCLPASAFNFSTCPGSGERRICSHHGVCSNEGKCICQPDWTGKDCSIHNPLPTSPPTGETERYKGPSGTNIIIGSIAGAVLVAAIVLGGTGWGFKKALPERRARSPMAPFAFSLCLAPPWLLKKHPPGKVRPDPAGGSVTPATSSLPLSLSPPSHSSPHILLMGSWGLNPHPCCHCCHYRGGRALLREESPQPAPAPSSHPPALSGPGPFPPALPMARPPLARWALELCPPQPFSPGRGAYLCVPSVLSSMSPLS